MTVREDILKILKGSILNKKISKKANSSLYLLSLLLPQGHLRDCSLTFLITPYFYISSLYSPIFLPAHASICQIISLQEVSHDPSTSFPGQTTPPVFARQLQAELKSHYTMQVCVLLPPPQQIMSILRAGWSLIAGVWIHSIYKTKYSYEK